MLKTLETIISLWLEFTINTLWDELIECSKDTKLEIINTEYISLSDYDNYIMLKLDYIVSVSYDK